MTAKGKFILDVLHDDDNDNDSQITISKSRATTKFRKADDPTPQVLDFTKLIFCICIDILGSVNEAIPLAGEFVDVIYAPIAALLLRQLFAGSNVVALLEFTEEILPFTDVLPLVPSVGSWSPFMDLVIWRVDLELEGIQIERMQKIEGIEDNNVVIRLK